MSARESYILALLDGCARDVAFDVALARWRAHNAGVPEPTARRALIKLLATTVWTRRTQPSASFPMNPPRRDSGTTTR